MDFFELVPERILGAVEKAGVKCTGRCLQLNSMENRVYELEIEVDEKNISKPSDKFLISKFYRPNRWTKEQILEEHEFLKDLKENEIPVVAPYLFPDSSSLKEQDGIMFTLFPKQGGRIPDELNTEELLIVGRLLARLHNIGQTKEAPNRLVLDPETYGLSNLDFLIENEIIPTAFENNYEQIVENICEISFPWFEDADYQRIHGDCHHGNILHGNDGFFLVDFDDMLTGPCIQDLWLLCPGRDEDSKQKLETLLEGYQQMKPFDQNSLRLIEPLRALRMVHFSAWIAKRWDDPSFQRTFIEYGTDKYWSEEIQALMECLELMQGNPLNH